MGTNSTTKTMQLPGWVMRDKQALHEEPAARRLALALINAGTILAPATRDPRQFVNGALPATAPPHLPANDLALRLVPSGLPAQVRHPNTNPTLRPLAQFSWGGTLVTSRQGVNKTQVPRISADHLLLQLSAGSIRLGFPRLDLLLSNGAVAFIPAGTAFSLQHLGALKGEVLIIPADLVRQTGVVLPSQVVSARPNDADAAAIRTYCQALGQMPRSTPPGHQRRTGQVAAARLLNKLALILPRLQQSAAASLPPAVTPHGSRPLVERFLRLAKSNTGCETTIADFAQDLGVSTAQLDQACKIQRGRSALQIVHDLRFDHAVALLRAGTPHAEIAALAGYVGPAHMKRAFIAATGRSLDDFIRDTAYASS